MWKLWYVDKNHVIGKHLMFKLESIVIMLTIDIKGICILNELRDNGKSCEHVHCVSVHFIVKELTRRVL